MICGRWRFFFAAIVNRVRLPSQLAATTAPAVSRTMELTQATNRFSHSSGFQAREHTIEGVVRGNTMWLWQRQECCIQSRLDFPYASMSFQLSAPLSTAAMAINNISSSRGGRFRFTRGSFNSAKHFREFSMSPLSPVYPLLTYSNLYASPLGSGYYVWPFIDPAKTGC